ncbi:hypothetical protein [Nocardia sp. NPDC055049]
MKIHIPVRVPRVTQAAIDRGLVLHALLDKDRLTPDAIAAHVDRSPRRVRRALRILHHLSMARPMPIGTAWEITNRGRDYATRPMAAVV